MLKILGVGVVKNACGQSGDGTLKLTLSEEWTNGINWFFACWCRFITVKSWSKFYWVGMVKNGCSNYMNRVDYFNVDFLVRLISYSLIFKCQGSTAVVLLVLFFIYIFILYYKILRYSSCFVLL